MRTIRTYSEMMKLSSFEERFEYLKIGGKPGAETFGFDRYLNQIFYRSKPWRDLRNEIIIRDDGNDLGVDGYPIGGKIIIRDDGKKFRNKIIIHHMNPITKADIDDMSDYLFNPEYLICCSHNTHNAIHYGDASLLPKLPKERRPNDQCPWLE